MISGQGIAHHDTHPSPNLALPQAAFLTDFVRPTKLLHVPAEITLPTVLRAPAGLTFSTHAGRALDLLQIRKQTDVRRALNLRNPICSVPGLVPNTPTHPHRHCVPQKSQDAQAWTQD